MSRLQDLSGAELHAFHERIVAEFEEFCARGHRFDMTRGKPAPEQLDLSNALLRLPDNLDFYVADGTDARNYGGSPQGIAEARELFSPMLGAPPEQIVIGNNSSLAVMHSCIVYALLKGVAAFPTPWKDAETVAFLCPVPGYDRHFAICEEFGIEMIPVQLTGHGPDMDEVERLASYPSVKGMWCVPKYSNPSGENYSDETVRRLARMKTASPDFRLFWDNAYALHQLTQPRAEILNILEICAEAGNPDRAFVFGSTSKVTFGGGGLALFASSPENVAWFLARQGKRTIGPDKLSQLRHVRYLKDAKGLDALMERHCALIRPKFEAVYAAFEKHLSGTGAARWSTPGGGYFVNVDVVDGCAARAIELAKTAGVGLVPPGATYPYGHDPRDRNIRVAPTYPELEEVERACEGIALAILLGVSEKLLAEFTEGEARRESA